MLYFFPIPLLIGILALATSVFILRRRKRSTSYLLCFSVFGLYLLVVIDAVFFPIPLLRAFGHTMTKDYADLILWSVNVVPFSYLDFPHARVVFREIVQNVLLTLPGGFGINFLKPLRTGHILWLGFAVGLCIEITQLVLSLTIAGMYRTIDITDVLLNAAGVLLGYGLFRVFAWLYLATTRRWTLSHQGLSAYVLEVVSRPQ